MNKSMLRQCTVLLTCLTPAFMLSGCSGSQNNGVAASAPLSAKASLGKALFFDTRLSASGRQSCGTCHVPSRAFAANDGLAVPLGGPNMDLPGFRNAPSLMYASFTPPFSIKNGAVGGFFRDGRAPTLAIQAEQPLITPFEMANANAAEVVTRLQAGPNLTQFESVYGSDILDNPDKTLTAIGQAIAAFETEDPSFHPFSSKYDTWLEGNATLTTQEMHGFALFNNPNKGNCTACHVSQVGQYSQHALFTDFSYDNIGVPRNWDIAANQPDPISPVDGVPLTYVPKQTRLPSDSEYTYYDLGLCGPLAPINGARPDFSTVTSLCGQFKVPTLRNIAVTSPYFHNGVFTTLREVVEWYVTRDINNNPDNNPIPETNPYNPAGSFYLAADGSPDRLQYNDIPVDYNANVNIGEVPYTPPTFQGGQAPTLDSAEIDDVVAFLCTLTDGYDPGNPAAYDASLPSQCPQSTTPSTP
ncbi:MAG: cytochrome-c peroxidase [Stenotrophobium sp.]